MAEGKSPPIARQALEAEAKQHKQEAGELEHLEIFVTVY
jgi:hypothetical protein